jgi:hypothetical protein
LLLVSGRRYAVVMSKNLLIEEFRDLGIDAGLRNFSNEEFGMGNSELHTRSPLPACGITLLA